MKKTTSESYRKRLIDVIDYIFANLGGDLDVNTLADIALMSPYHFHRIYREMAQEPINVTVRRLRLQQAAADLIRTELPLSSIAKKVAYGSQEAFALAFTKNFGITPGAYREQRAKDYRKDDLVEAPFIATLPTQQKKVSDMFTVDIIDNEAVSLVGYHHQGDYMEVGNVFEKLFIYAGSNGLFDESTRSIGLYYDDPQTVEKENLRSMACISLDKTVTLEGGDCPERVRIPAGKCAAVLFKGPYAELENPYNWLFGQ